MKPVDLVLEAGGGTRPTHRGRLFRRYFLLILALVCGVLLISGGIGLYFSHQENKVALSSLQREKAVSAAARIEDFIHQIEAQLQFAALLQLGAEGMEQRKLEFSKLLRMVRAVTDVAYVDGAGREQLVESRLGISVAGSGNDRSAEPFFREARPNQTWFGPVYFRKETEPYMQIAVRSRAGGPVTVADVNLKFIWDVVTRIRIGRSGKAFVVDETGHLVADPDIGLVLRKTDLSSLPQVSFALQKDAADSTALNAHSIAGEPVLTAYATIESLGWKVFVEQPVSEVYAALNAAILRTASLMLAGLLISALVALWLARSLAYPIRTLQEGSARIGAGELDQRIDIRTGDELQALADEFNRMTARLRESYASLERKVEERTAELQETLEQQTATAEILKVISASPTDVQPVFEAIVKSAAQLFEPWSATVTMVQNDLLTWRASSGPDFRASDIEEIRKVFPVPLGSAESPSALAIREARVVEIVDTEHAGNLALATKSGRAGNFRSAVFVPLIREHRGIGTIVLTHPETGRRLGAKQLALVQTFADQAVIAIENVRLFREIQEKSAQLEVANKHKSDFLANMSHELRTPLNAIIGFSEVLTERMFGEVNDKQLDYLRDIHSSGRHLLSLINDILDLSKIEAGRMELDVSEFDLTAAVANAMTLVKERAQRHGVALRAGIEPGLGAIRADERKFKQIMLNLLSNAVKFTPEGGSVTVSARRADGGVEVAVADTGIGIAPEDQAVVFEEFKQVGRDYTRKAEGTGLGLALTRRFVELHGGELRLDSAPGRGSTFTFTIPVTA